MSLTNDIQTTETLTIDADEPAFIGHNLPSEDPTDAFDLPPFYGSIIRDVMHDVTDNLSSNLAQQNVRLVDKFHSWDAETYKGWRGSIREAPNDTPQKVAKMSERAYEHLFEVMQAGTELIGLEYPPEAKETDNALRALADYCATQKLVYKPFRGGWTERHVADAIEAAYDDLTVVLGASEISKVTDYDDPEASGIDAYIPEEDLTLQIKEGEGGGTNDESDVIARYCWDIRGPPEVRLADN